MIRGYQISEFVLLWIILTIDIGLHILPTGMCTTVVSFVMHSQVIQWHSKHTLFFLGSCIDIMVKLTLIYWSLLKPCVRDHYWVLTTSISLYDWHVYPYFFFKWYMNTSVWTYCPVYPGYSAPKYICIDDTCRERMNRLKQNLHRAICTNVLSAVYFNLNEYGGPSPWAVIWKHGTAECLWRTM